MGDQPVARPLPAHRTAETQNKRTETFMPQVGFEPTIPVFKQAKTVHILDGAATVIGTAKYSNSIQHSVTIFAKINEINSLTYSPFSIQPESNLIVWNK
jgi:hypothetical protein